ncbi:MAG: hypothetical protein AB1716_01075, partial [Planctomycetota bacterium]
AERTVRRARAGNLAADAAAILRCRSLPQQASEIGLPQADVLQRVAAAMRAAGLSAQSLVSTLPQPVRKLPGSGHAEVVNRLVFENVALEPLVRFGHALTTSSPELRVAGLQLRAGGQRQVWNAEVSVAYLVLSPEAGRK